MRQCGFVGQPAACGASRKQFSLMTRHLTNTVALCGSFAFSQTFVLDTCYLWLRMANIIAVSVLYLLLAGIALRVTTWRKNYAVAKSSGLPVFYSP